MKTIQKQSLKIAETISQLPPLDVLLTSEPTQEEILDFENDRIHWGLIGWSWHSRCTGNSDPLDKMLSDGYMSPWGAEYFKLRTDYFWALWLLVQDIEPKIKRAFTRKGKEWQYKKPGDYFEAMISKISKHSVLRRKEPYFRYSITNQKRKSMLVVKTLASETTLRPHESARLKCLLKEHQLSDPEQEIECIKLLSDVLEEAHKRAYKPSGSRTKALLEDIERATARLEKHCEKHPKVRHKIQELPRSFTYQRGCKTYG